MDTPPFSQPIQVRIAPKAKLSLDRVLAELLQSLGLTAFVLAAALVVIVSGWARPKPPPAPEDRDPAKLPPELKRILERGMGRGHENADGNPPGGGLSVRKVDGVRSRRVTSSP